MCVILCVCVCFERVDAAPRGGVARGGGSCSAASAVVYSPPSNFALSLSNKASCASRERAWMFCQDESRTASGLASG